VVAKVLIAAIESDGEIDRNGPMIANLGYH